MATMTIGEEVGWSCWQQTLAQRRVGTLLGAKVFCVAIYVTMVFDVTHPDLAPQLSIKIGFLIITGVFRQTP